MHSSVSVLIAALSASAFALPQYNTNNGTFPNYKHTLSSSTTPHNRYTTPDYIVSYAPVRSPYNHNDKTKTTTETVTTTETKSDAYYIGGKPSYSTYVTSYIYTTKYAAPAYQTHAAQPTYQADKYNNNYDYDYDYQENHACPAAYTITTTITAAPSGAHHYYSPQPKMRFLS